ncbi:MAG TPA: gfo/Idh/MocA family oxidoreductase [Thermoguttaceae bacterium]|nr:gfo/Idh/MocA family oxidoreductase [Thermoguttaceae bacterium]
MEREVQSSPTSSRKSSRREFVALGGKAAAGAAMASMAVPPVHAAEDNTIRLAQIGCGPRGNGAVGNALSVPNSGPVKLFAMADVFEDRVARSHKALSKEFPEQVDVPPERQFVGFDAYRKAIDCLRPGDVALLTTRAYPRPTHLDYAVEKGVNVFMEKSFAPDPGGLKRMIRAGERAEKKNLKIAAGVMCRHSVARQALIRKIRDGELGEIHLIRAARMGGGGTLPPRKPDDKELLYQVGAGKIHLLWSSSGLMIELLIHQIDECCWLKDAWPVSAHGLGGCVPHSGDCGQNHHAYSMEYTFADGSTALVSNRNVPKCYNDFATYVHGTQRAAQFSGNIHAPTVHTYKDQRTAKENIDWVADDEPCTPWQAEWNVLIDAIRNDRPHNETRRACLANLVAVMGRAAVHSGQVITWDQMLASDFLFCDYVDDLDYDSPAPVQPDADGRYPAPIPGEWSEI